MKAYFKDEENSGFNDKNIGNFRTMEKGHWRIEERLYYYYTDISWMNARKDWEKLKGIGIVIRRYETKGRVTEECVYYLASVSTVEEYARGVRLHWGVESMHWSLDVTFREDANRTGVGKASQNLALLKRMAMNMVKKDQERFPKRSLRSRRFLASLKRNYLEYIFSINFR